jgi:hypothetical protein
LLCNRYVKISDGLTRRIAVPRVDNLTRIVLSAAPTTKLSLLADLTTR